MSSISEITESAHTANLPQASELGFSDEAVQGAGTELNLVTASLIMKVQRLIETKRHNHEPYDPISIVKSEIENLLDESEAKLARKDKLTAGLGLAASDPAQDARNRMNSNRALMLRDDALVDLLDDEAKLKWYTQEILEEGSKKADREIKVDTLELDLVRVVGQEAIEASKRQL